MHTAETDNYIYFGEPYSKDTKYYGKVYYKNGISYHGSLINSLKNGYGERYELNGNYKKGVFIDDKLNGKGISYNKEREAYYIGNFTNGKLDGLITCVYDNKKKVIKKTFKNGLLVKENKVQPIVKEVDAVEVDAVEKPIVVRKIIIKKPTRINSTEIINKYS